MIGTVIKIRVPESELSRDLMRKASEAATQAERWRAQANGQGLARVRDRDAHMLVMLARKIGGKVH